MQPQLTVAASIKAKETSKVESNSESNKTSVNDNDQDYTFQALTYLYEASAKLSISQTLLSAQQVDPSTLAQLIEIQTQLEEFQEKLCQIAK